MNSRKGGGKAPYSPAANFSTKGKSVSPQYGHPSGGSGYVNNPESDQMTHDVAQLSIHDRNDAGWEVMSKKTKNRGGATGPKQWASNGSGGTKSPEGAWQAQRPNFAGPTSGRGKNGLQSSNRGWETAYMAPPPVVPPPLAHGWQWNARAGSTQPKEDDHAKVHEFDCDVDSDLDDEDDAVVENSDDDFLSDDSDSDEKPKNHELRKQHKWFKDFFGVLDKLSIEELNEPSRQWHCPACKNGPGAIDWYRGLQPLMAHAKTKGATRVKLHRELAEVLDEELHRRGTSVIPVGEAYGKWKGLRETVSDHEIVWPPMVMIRNTILEQDENDKWKGMGNQELLDYFREYSAVKARHSYGPKGHRGISLLIFENTAMGYVEAERLHKHFSDQGTDRDAWDRRRVLFLPGGNRQLYGYLANKEDLDDFNQHCQGKTKLKFEMRSHQEMVVGPMRQMNEDNQQIEYLRNKVAKEQKHSKALEQSFGVMSEKLRKTMQENRIVRQRTQLQHEQNKEEMDDQQQFFEDQIKAIHEALEEKERAFEELLRKDRTKIEQSTVDSSTIEDKELRQEKIAKFIQTQAEDITEFEGERDKLVIAFDGKRSEMKRKHLQEEVDLEKEFDAALTDLMKQYTPQASE